jgi:protein SCO1/2
VTTLGLALALALALTAPPPPALAGLDVVEHLGDRVPLDLKFTDHLGYERALRDAVSGQRPILLLLVYYRCPMLCNLVLGATANALAHTGWLPGRELDAVTVSFDPDETQLLAAEKRRGFVSALGLPEATPAWPFFTGRAREINALAQSLGFSARRDPKTGQYAHVAVSFILTPTGQISRYLYGIEQPPRAWKLALGEAAGGHVGTTLDRVLLHCYRYDPATRRYGLYVYGFLRAGGLLVFVLLAGLLAHLWRREARARSDV